MALHGEKSETSKVFSDVHPLDSECMTAVSDYVVLNGKHTAHFAARKELTQGVRYLPLPICTGYEVLFFIFF